MRISFIGIKDLFLVCKMMETEIDAYKKILRNRGMILYSVQPKSSEVFAGIRSRKLKTIVEAEKNIETPDAISFAKINTEKEQNHLPNDCLVRWL
jgi:hypothetical protein